MTVAEQHLPNGLLEHRVIGFIALRGRDLWLTWFRPELLRYTIRIDGVKSQPDDEVGSLEGGEPTSKQPGLTGSGASGLLSGPIIILSRRVDDRNFGFSRAA